MDLTTTYMGLKLKNPIVASASTLTYKLDGVRKLEDAGCAAIVMHSLFEEQLAHEALELHALTTQGSESFAEATSYFPESEEYNLGPEEYLKHIQQAKSVVKIPIIASLNGFSSGGWVDYAKKMQEAGADALELNVYYLATNPELAGSDVEKNYIDVLKAVKSNVKIPVAMKLGPYFSNMTNMARKLDEAKADALVLFNRFYQPDLDLENLTVWPHVELSTSAELRLPLRWIAILFGNVKCNIAATTGVHTAQDVLKTMMAGANVAMMCSAIYKNGHGHIGKVLGEIETWMKENEYASISDMRGSMSQKSIAEPGAYERANYMKTLQSYHTVV